MLVGISIGVTLILVGAVLFWINMLRRRAVLEMSDEQIQQEVAEYITREFPGLKVREISPGEIKIENAAGEGSQLFTVHLIAAVRASRGRMQDRERIYGQFTRLLEVSAGTSNVPPISSQTEQILPRLVHREYIENVSSSEPVHRRLGETPLHVAYVVDEETTVRFLTSKDLAELAMTIEQLDELAMRNFRRKLPEGAFRDIMARPGKATVISEADSYDASRLLLIMDKLGPGDVIAAAVPDRDTLVVVPSPDEATWPALERMAATPRTSRIIFMRPLRVTSMGIEVR